jgi:hypothetical protein
MKARLCFLPLTHRREILGVSNFAPVKKQLLDDAKLI